MPHQRLGARHAQRLGDMNPANSEFAESLIGFMAVGRYGQVAEIASFVAYLAGPEAGYITGASLTIDGGFSA